MKLLRTLPTRRLLALLAAVAGVAVAAAALAVTAFGGGGATPPPEPLAQAIHDALAAQNPDGVSARITFTNRLFPSGALLGQAGSALMSGASGRLWATADGRGRIELQSDAGDAQIVWNATTLTVYDASSNTVYRVGLPSSTGNDTSGTQTPPSVTDISNWLAKVEQHATVSAAQPDNVARQPAYSVTVSPKQNGGLLGAAELAWDAAQGVPLRMAVYARGGGTPVLELAATDISYGPVSSSDVAVAPPADAKVVDLGGAGGQGDAGQTTPSTPTTGLDAVQAAVSFPLVAPDSLAGLPRQRVQLLGGKTSKGALLVYGEGLGALVVVERPVDSSTGGSPLDALPTVSLEGVTGHELATPLGTAVEFQRAGVSFVVAGSVDSATAESAAKALR